MNTKKVVTTVDDGSNGKISPFQYIGETEFNAFKEYDDKIIVLCFTASWCGPCKQIKPVLKQLQEQRAAHCLFLFCDVDVHEAFCATHGIRAMPTFKIFRGSVLLSEFKGANAEQLIRELTIIERSVFYSEYKII